MVQEGGVDVVQNEVIGGKVRPTICSLKPGEFLRANPDSLMILSAATGTLISVGRWDERGERLPLTEDKAVAIAFEGVGGEMSRQQLVFHVASAVDNNDKLTGGHLVEVFVPKGANPMVVVDNSNSDKPAHYTLVSSPDHDRRAKVVPASGNIRDLRMLLPNKIKNAASATDQRVVEISFFDPAEAMKTATPFVAQMQTRRDDTAAVFANNYKSAPPIPSRSAK